MQTLSLLQARVSSTRLPGKVMKPLLGRPMILRQIERLRCARNLGQLVVVTSAEPSDDPLADLCKADGVPVFRGSLADVLDRFYQAALPCQPENIVRLTADCPLADPELIDNVIAHYLAGGFDYVSNCLEPTFPDGLDVEVFHFRCLVAAWNEARLPSQREHVTPFIHGQPERFSLGSFKSDQDLSAMRWTVDEPADFHFVERIYQELYPTSPAFRTQDILNLLATHQDLASINQGFIRNEGLLKSLVVDRKALKP